MSHRSKGIQSFHVCVTVQRVVGGCYTANLLVLLSLVSNRENWIWEVVFSIKDLHVRPLCTSSLLFISHNFSSSPDSSALYHSYPSSRPPDTHSRKEWFMLVITGRTCCCSTGVRYDLHNMYHPGSFLSLWLSFSDSSLASRCFIFLKSFRTGRTHSDFPFSVRIPFFPRFSSLPPPLDALISFLPWVKITAVN